MVVGFKMYDPNMKELKFPVGVKPLDFSVSSIEKERYTENIKGIPGSVDYSFDYKGRNDCSLTFWLRHYHAEHDFQLLVSELNSMLDSQPYFYVSRDSLPTRVLKLTIDEAYTPERILGSMYAKLEVPVNIVGLPFWRTKYTTQDIETLGFDAIAEKFGTAGGNVTLDPRNMPLKIKLKHLLTDGNFKLTNKTTGETFEYYAPRTGNTVDLDGVQAFVGYQANRLRETNRKYISIVPGINEIEYSGGTMDDIQFDFPLYYK